jgi:dimethylhistidine N-methyltransferase
MNVVDRFRDFSVEQKAFHSDVVEGLGEAQKSLPCKYFYDEAGSRLFDAICELEEYYPTRTELGLLQAHGQDIAALAGEGIELIEFGCGSLQKIRVLLSAMTQLEYFVPIDISREHLLASAQRLSEDFPGLTITPLCADYTQPLVLDDPEGLQKRIGFFPGSTIGNFTRQAAVDFLRVIAGILGIGGELIIGVDLKKDHSILHAAYNDSQGITADFNLNILKRINRELDGQFDLNAFRHLAEYNDGPGRIEMHLESLQDQTVLLGDQSFTFRTGERIHTENSHKYSIEEFVALAGEAGLEPMECWADQNDLFSVHYLRVVEA